MHRRLSFTLVAAAALAGCQHVPYDEPSRGVAATNVPVVARSDYVIDLAAYDGALAPGEAERLDSWFRSLGLGYGDSIYVEGYAEIARSQVATIAGRYGLMLSEGAPVTPSAIPQGAVRVVVTRTRASVPGCPNWSGVSQPNYQNKTMSNFGCAVNSNLAAMVANPEDLVHGREGSPVVDAMTSAKAVASYRSTAPTGTRGLDDINTRKGK